MSSLRRVINGWKKGATGSPNLTLTDLNDINGWSMDTGEQSVHHTRSDNTRVATCLDLGHSAVTLEELPDVYPIFLSSHTEDPRGLCAEVLTELTRLCAEASPFLLTQALSSS